MRVKVAGIVAVLGILLAGCAGLMPRSYPCTAGVCKVKVSVDACKPKAFPDPVNIPRGVYNIHWELVTNGWSFTENGIVVRKGVGTVFTNPRRVRPDLYIWTDNNNRGDSSGEFKYDINVTNGTTVCHEDPIIAND